MKLKIVVIFLVFLIVYDSVKCQSEEDEEKKIKKKKKKKSKIGAVVGAFELMALKVAGAKDMLTSL